MTIALLAAGSRGDVQPFVALGVELEARGHAVRVAAPASFRGLVEAHGLGFHPVGSGMEQAMNDRRVQDAMRASHPLAVIRSFRDLGELAFVLQAGFYEACEDASAVVFHPGASIGHVAARQRNVPSILASPFPMTPTRAYPALIFYAWPGFGGWLNWLSHKIFERMMWQASKGNIERFFRESGASAPPLRMPFPQQTTDRHPTIVSCSEHVFPRPGDWPRDVHLTGYWFLDADPGWTPPADLVDFLDAGTAPVYVGFGSMRDPGQARASTHIVVEALRAAGRRGILASGEGGLSRTDVPDDIHVLDEAPHAWLFPRVSAVVHHGGAGTTAAALRAGVPNVVVPHANDQPGWAKRLHELGVAPSPIPKARLDATRLAGALVQAHAPDLMRRASELGSAIRSESGAAVAADVVERAIRAAPANGVHREGRLGA